MKLTAVNYSEFLGDPREWRIEGLSLRDSNLIVGKNSTGKSRIISIISTLSKLLSGLVKMVYIDGNFDVLFEHDGSQMQYVMEHRNFQVTREEFSVDGKKLLRRGQGGYGHMIYEEVGRELKFQAPADQLAVVVRRDKEQHNVVRPQNETTKARCLWYGRHDQRRTSSAPASRPRPRRRPGGGSGGSSWESRQAGCRPRHCFSNSAGVR